MPNSAIIVSIKNSPFYDDNSISFTFNMTQLVQTLVLQPKTASPSQVNIKAFDSVYGYSIPNLAITIQFPNKNYTGTTNELGEVSVDGALLSECKGKTIQFAVNDERFSQQTAYFSPVTINQGRTFVVLQLQADFALEVLVMKGLTGLLGAKIEVKLNEQLLATSLSNTNGKYVFFGKRSQLTAQDQVFMVTASSGTMLKTATVVRRNSKQESTVIWMQVFALVSVNMSDTEVVENAGFEFYINNEFQQILYTNHRGYLILNESHKIAIGNTLRFRLVNDYIYQDSELSFQLQNPTVV